MKTAEEILKNTHSFLDDSMGRCYEEVEVLSAMDEYASQSKHPAPSEWVEECIKALRPVINSCLVHSHRNVPDDILRTALQSVTLPQPKQVDLDEVESIVQQVSHTKAS
jgi:hypothetical protein